MFHKPDDCLTFQETSCHNPNYDKEKENEMLPEANGNGKQTTNRNRNASGIPYLKEEHLTKQPKEVRILAVKPDPDNKFGAAVVLKVAMEGKTFFYTVRTNNPNYGTLLDKFGRDPNDWVQKNILIGLEQDEFSERYFPTVTFPAEKKSAR